MVKLQVFDGLSWSPVVEVRLARVGVVVRRASARGLLVRFV